MRYNGRSFEEMLEKGRRGRRPVRKWRAWSVRDIGVLCGELTILSFYIIINKITN